MYHNVFEIETALFNLAAAHPAIAERITLPETSWENHWTISCLRIGSHAAHAADGALFICGQHAREWVPPEIALGLLADMLDAYANNHGLTYGGKSYTAMQVRHVLDNINIFVVACVNPDGRAFSQSVDDTFHKDWRRNRNTSVHTNPSCQGVDLNRNYDFTFDLAKYYDLTNPAVTSRTSTNPCHPDQVYQGPSPFSEPETRNVRWLLDSYPRLRWFIDIHGFRSEIYYPWADDENQTTDASKNWRNPAWDHRRGRESDAYSEFISAADRATHVSLATRLREGIQPVRGRSYLVTQTFTLYPAAGTSTDYVWSRHLADPGKPRVEGFAIEVAGSDDPAFSGFRPSIANKDAIVSEVTSGLINFCLAVACGVPGLSATLLTANVVFNSAPEGRVSSRPVILQVTGCEAVTFRIISGPSRTGGSTRISFGTAVSTRSAGAIGSPATRDLYLWLTASGGLAGDTATGTVRVECPQTAQVFDVNLLAEFVRAPRAGAVLVLDRSGSMSGNGGDGRTRLAVLLDSAPAFVDLAPPASRIGLVRFATDASPGAPMTTMGPEGPDPGGRDVIRAAIMGHMLATGDASWTSIGDGVHAGNALIAPEGGVELKALVVLTDGHENRPRFLSEVAGLINDRVFAIGLGTPEEIQPIALNALTNGTGGYMLMTGMLDADDPYRLAKYYLQILTGVTNDQIVLDPDGWLPFGAEQVIPFHLNEADLAVDTILLIPFPRLVRMRLRTPAGAILDETSPVLKWTMAHQVGFYRFTLPVPGEWSAEGPGRWEILLDWRRNWKRLWDRERRNTALFAATTGRKALRYKALVHARSDLAMVATVGQSAQTPGADVTIRVHLTQYASVPIDGARVYARVRFPDGSVSMLGLAALGEGIYEATFRANLSGVYTIRITAEGRSLRGAPFTREAVRTAAVWRGGDSEPPRPTNESWCATLRCLLESGALNREVLKRLGVDVERILRCCPPEEPERKPPIRRRRK